MNARDSQRSAVYAWEKRIERELKKNFPKDVQYPIHECQRLVDKIWADFGMEGFPPEVKGDRRKRNASANRWFVWLPISTRIPATILHEVAHSVLHQVCIEKQAYREKAWHDEEFAALILLMYNRYLGASQYMMKKIAGEGKHVKIARVTSIPRPVREINPII